MPDISTDVGIPDGPLRESPGAGPRLLGLLGPESSGKTTLGRDLARELDAVLVPEALRAFVDRHGRPPRREEQPRVMDEQLALECAAVERAVTSGRQWVVCDPCVLMTPVYSIVYFGDDSLLPAGLAHQRAYGLTFRCSPDIPWRPDPGQRDGRALRARVNATLSDLIRDHGLRTRDLTGSAVQRLATALQLVRKT